MAKKRNQHISKSKRQNYPAPQQRFNNLKQFADDRGQSFSTRTLAAVARLERKKRYAELA